MSDPLIHFAHGSNYGTGSTITPASPNGNTGNMGLATENPSDLQFNRPQTLGITNQQHFMHSGEALEFPMNVASADLGTGNHGHYIIFHINEQDRARLTMSGRAGGGSIAENLADPYNVPAFVRNYKAQFSRYQTTNNSSGDEKLVKRMFRERS